MPRDTDAAATAGSQGQPGESAAAADTRPGGGLGNPLDPEGKDDPWAKYKWWILGALGLVMAVGAGIMLNGGPQGSSAPLVPGTIPGTIPGAAPEPGGLLSAMKEELFALESDRLQGRLSEAEYAEQKTALEVVLRRALARSEHPAAASNVAEPDA